MREDKSRTNRSSVRKRESRKVDKTTRARAIILAFLVASGRRRKERRRKSMEPSLEGGERMLGVLEKRIHCYAAGKIIEGLRARGRSNPRSLSGARSGSTYIGGYVQGQSSSRSASELVAELNFIDWRTPGRCTLVAAAVVRSRHIQDPFLVAHFDEDSPRARPKLFFLSIQAVLHHV